MVLAREYSGSDSSSTYQDTTATFDGHGRLKTSHKPENRDSSNNLTYSTFNYNADDTVADVTDPRGAVTAYKYGNIDDSTSEYRALLTKVLYTSPDTSTIPDPTDVILTYDNAGNRLTMIDGTGELEYSYDELSRLKVETKDFADTLEDELSGGYTLTYSYTLTGGIKSITDPFGAQVAYTTDKIGRTTAIGNGSSSTAFASGIAYRAFGGVKSMNYSTTDETNITLSYNTRLRPATYESESDANTIDIQNKTYTYNEDGAIKQAADNVESKFGQLYEYDFASRLKKNQFGTGSTSPTPQYKQLLGYDAFSNLTNRQTWDKDNNERTFSAAYTNNRKTTGGYGIGTDTHDNAGNVVENIVSYTPMDKRTWKFDAAGRMADWEETSTYLGSTRWDQGAVLTFDGDGRTAKRETRRRVWASPPTGWYTENEYTIFSSVTGQPIVELNLYGAMKKTNIYMGSSVIAEQVGTSSPFTFRNIDPVTGSSMATEADGDFPPNDSGRTETEPLGAVIPTQDPESSAPYSYPKGGHVTSPEYGGCAIDGALQPDWRDCASHLATGGGDIGPLNPRIIRTHPDGSQELIPLHKGPEGYGRWKTLESCVTLPDGSKECTQRPGWIPAGEGELEASTPLNQEECDKFIGSLFGGSGAFATTRYEFMRRTRDLGKGPDGIRRYEDIPGPPIKIDSIDHLANSGTFHIFPDEVGSDDLAVGLFVPKGANVSRLPGERRKLSSNRTNTFVFHWNDGPWKGISVSLDHVGGTHGGDFGGQYIDSAYLQKTGRGRRSSFRFTGPTNAAGSHQIGLIGGLGGRRLPQFYTHPRFYRHTHVQVYRNGVLTDPRKVFCGWK